MTDAQALDIVTAFLEGGPAGEVPAGVAVDRLLKRHAPAHAFHSLFLLLDQRLVDWRSSEGRLSLAAEGHWYEVAAKRLEELGIELPHRGAGEAPGQPHRRGRAR